MNIKSMSEMEDIVLSNSSLIWEQFNVVEIKNTSPNAPLKKQARYINGQWHTVKVYESNCSGLGCA